jgi:hypothetical protein
MSCYVLLWLYSLILLHGFSVLYFISIGVNKLKIPLLRTFLIFFITFVIYVKLKIKKNDKNTCYYTVLEG